MRHVVGVQRSGCVCPAGPAGKRSRRGIVWRDEWANTRVFYQVTAE
ncbi:hypothetical protein CSE45_0693 [Citreicella sp. SE45]|nr:hypothetical protein CSE45_0693 [Citreicella sp. SE45]